MGVARAELAHAAAVPNPVFEVEALPERSSNVELRVEYDVTGLVVAPLRAHAASPELDAARYRAAASVVDTGRVARAAYFRALASQKKLALAKQALDAVAAIRDAAEALLKAGNMTELDFATAEAAYETARADAADVELAALDAREALVRTLGLHGAETSLTLAGELPDAPEHLAASDDLETRALRASFEMKAKRQHLEALGRRSGVARAEGWIPDVAADIHAFQGVRNPTTGQVTDEGWAFSGGVRLSVPIFDRKQGGAARLDAEAAADLERYIGAAVSLRSNARALYARLVTAHAKAKQYVSVIVPARRRVFEQSLLQYNAMQIGVFRLLEAKHDELASELAATTALEAYWNAQTAFDALLAGGAADTGKD
jgi:outer membrane protein TolC